MHPSRSRSGTSRCKESSMLCAWRTALLCVLGDELLQPQDVRHRRPADSSPMQRGAETRRPAAPTATTSVSPKSRRVGPRTKALRMRPEITALGPIYRPRGHGFGTCLGGLRPAPRDGAFLPRNVTHVPVATLRTVAHILATQQQELEGAIGMAGSFLSRESTVAPPGYNRSAGSAGGPGRASGDRPGLCVLRVQPAAHQADRHRPFGPRRLEHQGGSLDVLHRHRHPRPRRPPYSAGGWSAWGRASPCSSPPCASAAASSSQPIGVHYHVLLLIYLGYGVLGGCGLGIGYISPVSTLIKWFPDRPGSPPGSPSWASAAAP